MIITGAAATVGAGKIMYLVSMNILFDPITPLI